MIRIWLTALLLSVLICAPAQAQVKDLSAFSLIPVQDGGRLKPIDSFARGLLSAFSGRDTPSGLEPNAWLAEALFDPANSVQRRIFSIDSPNLRHRLGLEERRIALYSYSEIASGLGKTMQDAETLLKKPRADLTPDERDLLDLHDHALSYTQILRTLSLIMPLELDLPKKFKDKAAPTYLDLRRDEQSIESSAAAIAKRKGADLERYSDEERKTALLAYQLKLLRESASRNQMMRLFPVPWDQGRDWLAPWAVLNQGQGAPETAEQLKLWAGLAQAWQDGDEAAWATLTQTASTLPLRLSDQEDHASRLKLELRYNQINPFGISRALYLLAFGLSLAYLIGSRRGFLAGGMIALFMGMAVHSIGIGTRMLLLERPPVSTLYESIIFVSWACALIGLLLEKRLRGGAGLLMGSLSAFFTIQMAQSFGSEGGTLLMLTAVLNTQFWLATHVVCITFGYGWCVAAAVLAHMALAAKALRLLPPERIEALTSTLMALSLVALLFVSVGTILGGIWADQSWGRFWGWDPKENGALLIVLWLVWAMHGKLSNHLKGASLFAALSFLAVIVGLAWIGVNLLGVGLHSYGFADGVMTGLLIYVAAELLFIGGLWALDYKRNGDLHAA